MLAAVTLFASCSEEELVSKTGGESLVNFTITAPELGSRAATIGNGSSATDLYYAVYDETINEIVTTISKTEQAKKETIAVGTVKEITLPLLNGHKYSLVFWATNDDGAYAIDWDNKSISLKDASALVSNNENYDAFYAYVEPFIVTGVKQSTVDLKRPFAQLNIGTTKTDLEGVAKYYGVDGFTKSLIVVSTPTAMDLTTGNVSNEKELTYAAADFIASEKLKTDYEYLSMNYLLVSNEKSLVNVNFSITADNKTISKTFENIPVQRNYKTNIYGNLFTSATEWEVEVKPGFNESEYNAAEQLAAVFEKGGEMTLYTDVELTEPLVLTEGKVVTLNLNGNTIKGGIFAESNGTISAGNTDSYPIYVQGGTLNIKGEGTIEAQAAKYSMAVFATAGEVNIYGGEFYNAGEGSDLIYAKGTAKINIYGGFFKACEKQAGTDGTAEKYSALNLHDGSKTTASITVYGGTFYQFDPANNKSENPAQSFVAEDYTSRLVGENYVVVEGTGVATAAELVTAITAGGTVILVDDIVFAEGLKLNANDAKINLNGHKINYTGADVLFRIEGGKNLTIDGTEDESAIVTNPTTLGTGGNGYVALVTEGSLTINGGSYDAQGTCTVAQVSKGKLIVNGGTFKVNMDKYTDANGEASYLLNCSDTPYKNGEAVIEVNGGSFYKFNPANNAAEGTGTTFLAPGHTSVKEGDWYVVK